MNFLSELTRRVLVLDGSMGALLQTRGLPAGMAPDVWMMENPEVILRAHQDYVEAGADIILTNTFGASKWRLAEYDAYSQIREINGRAVDIARKAMGGKGFIAGDIGPSGETVFPTGKKSFDEVWEIFHEQAKILVELGVDLIVVETMFDSLEFRAALSAVREASKTIPLVAHATFNTDGITDTGASPENIAAIAEGYHATAVGVNCSTGPEPMVGIVKKMAETTDLIISVQPNAGLPQIKGGKTVFPMNADDLQPYINRFIDAGAGIIGGCCGTTPQFIQYVKQIASRSEKVRRPARKNRVIVSSLSQASILGGHAPFLAIGERMNPSGRKKLSESLKKGELSMLLEDAQLQAQAGARMMDLNVGVPMVDEPALMKQAVVAVQNRFQIPLMIDSSNTHALDSGAQAYYGRPLLNSLNAEDEKLDEAIPVMKKHGAAIVCMTTGVDVPVKAEERLKNAMKIAERLYREGFRNEDFVFDCLGLVVSAMQDGSRETLRTLEMVKEAFPGSATTLGLSNVSFGLPNRNFVHNAFLTLAVERGLDSAIMSATDPIAQILAASAQMWGRKEKSIEHYIENFATKLEIGSGAGTHGAAAAAPTAPEKSGPKEPEFVAKLPARERDVFRGIVGGQKEAVEKLLTEYVAEAKVQGKDPSDAMRLFLDVMTPAIRYLGDLFGARIKFIPHLIAAADAMKSGVAVLEPLLLAARKASGQTKGTVIFATVKGDIHDIGKNICILMLRNFGYEVVDLGRNVEAELILQTAKERQAQVVALSALMTTTMMQMKVVIDAVKERQLPCKVVIGGAVVTPDFARDIQADGYSTDVGTVVSEMERVIAILEATTQPRAH